MRTCPRALILTLALVLPVGGCDLPKDPEQTLDRVRGGVMRVGISESRPWTVIENGDFRGIEVQLVEAFARELGARIEWIQGTESELLKALEEFRLDLVIAGLTEDTPWKSRVGLTRFYVSTASLIGLPAGIEIGEDPSGAAVAVVPGDSVAAALRQKGAEPVPVADLSSARRPVAAEDWQLAAWDFRPTPIVLAQHRHVIAVPPGENAWLVRLERFLAPREPDVRQALAAAAKR